MYLPLYSHSPNLWCLSIKNHKKHRKISFFFKNIWSIQKKAVPLHSVLKLNQVFLAQLVEQLTLNQWVQGSSPWEDTKDIQTDVFFLF